LATLIPSISTCVSRMTSGEKRFANQLEAKLEEDYLCWYDVSIGEHTRHPDFIIVHPSRGLLVLEMKDWKLETIHSIDKQKTSILTERGLVDVLNPIEQARQFMFAVTNKLERDPQLVSSIGDAAKGKLSFPYGHGVVLYNITRKQFENANIHEVLPSHLVICKDEMTENADAEVFQSRLWGMWPYQFKSKITIPQIDRIRWHLFPEIRIGAQADMFEEADHNSIEIPDVLRVMDIQQEQLARSLGEGHRVIHGVAGSGKTLILGYRAEYLAKICQRPILILCYNKSLASKLSDLVEAKGLQSKITAVNFHAWCVRQLKTYNVGTPPQDANLDDYFAACVDKVIRSVDQKLIPSEQYDAVLIDEGHDFKPEWLKLVVQMIHPDSNSLLVLYDDAQSIYSGKKKLRFSFSSVGVQAKGRTTILKLNYRNTAEILTVARAFADELLSPSDTEEDQAPTVQPMSTGRRGPKPLLIKLPTLRTEVQYITDKICDANKTGTPWNDMAIIYRRYGIGQEVANELTRKGIPFQWSQIKGQSLSTLHNSVKLVTMHSSKGLEFPLVCIPGIGAPSKDDEELPNEARLLYVAMTRATNELVMTYGEESFFAEKLTKAMDVLRVF
jgi:hypothetical protein